MTTAFQAGFSAVICATVISRYKDTRYKDILDARTIQWGTNHRILIAMVPLSKDNLM